MFSIFKKKKKVMGSFMGLPVEIVDKHFMPRLHIPPTPRCECSLRDWNDEELDLLDEKLDALMEYLGIEFVREEVIDGSVYAREDRCFMRKKSKK